jgi:FMN reductase
MHRAAPERVDDFRPVVLGLGGSTRRTSRALEALRLALVGAGRAGAHTTLLSVGELSLPILDAERPDLMPESVENLVGEVGRAHALILASPVYLETVSGALKNALDHLSVLDDEGAYALSGKVVGLVSVSGALPGMGASLALQTACRALGAWVLPESVNLGRASFDVQDGVCDLLARDRLLALGRRVARGAVARRVQDQVGAAASAWGLD